MHYRDSLQRAFARKRKQGAISPVIASIILIAVTIAVAIAVAGFVFGLFGTFTSTPQISVISGLVDANAAAAGDDAYNFQLTNTGTQDVTILGGSFQLGSAVQQFTLATPVVLVAGATATVDDAALDPLLTDMDGALVAGTSYIMTFGANDGTQTTTTGTVTA